MNTIRTFGIELEGGVYRRGTSDRVDLCEALNLGEHNGFHIALPGVAEIGTDNGRHEIELSLDPCATISEAEGKLGECLGVLAADWEVYWMGQDPFVRCGRLAPAPWAPKPRYGAIREVIAEESGIISDTDGGMDWMSQYWAYQIHFGIDPVSEKGNHLRNCLDNWGPHIARSACELLGTPSDRIERAWIGWGDERRLPGYRWFESSARLLSAWRNVPRLARESANGVWVPDTRRSLPEPGNPVHEGFVWWGARPRLAIGTIEFRWPDSLPPSAALVLTAWLLEYAEEVVRGWEPYRFSRDEWERIRGSRSFWLEYIRGRPDLRISF